jgi:glutathione synthase/RimK-type ligase-like ATP-grasp enzyme
MKMYAYNKYSKGAKALAKSLGIKRIRHKNSKFKPRVNTTIINWGSHTYPDKMNRCGWINKPYLVAQAANKLSFFKLVRGPHIPPWTEDKDEAALWSRDGCAVVCRTLLNSHSGKGIVIAATEEQLVDAPLYVKYIKKKDEFRVHIFRGKVFDVQRKARRIEHEHPDWQVRNHANGFIYQRNDVELPAGVERAALEVFERTGLDFGAFDIIYNAHEEKPYVLEVNTAPGLTGTTLENYTKIFKEFINK